MMKVLLFTNSLGFDLDSLGLTLVFLRAMRRTRVSSQNIGKISSYQVKLSEREPFITNFHVYKSNREVSHVLLV